MEITRKIVSVVFAFIMIISTFAITANAKSIYDTAVSLPSGKKQSFTLENGGSSKDYKIVLSKSGKVKFDVNTSIQYSTLYVYDVNGNSMEYDDFNVNSGNGSGTGDHFGCRWNDTTENAKYTISYELKKGTYYIRFHRPLYYNGTGETTLTATYDTEDSDAKISYLTLEMEVGDTLRLEVVVEPTDSEVKWTSTKKSIATVSASGKVAAKKEGTTIITAKCGTSVKNIKIIVVD